MSIKREATHLLDLKIEGLDGYQSYMIFRVTGEEPFWYDIGFIRFWEICANGLREQFILVNDIQRMILTKYDQKEGDWK